MSIARSCQVKHCHHAKKAEEARYTYLCTILDVYFNNKPNIISNTALTKFLICWMVFFAMMLDNKYAKMINNWWCDTGIYLQSTGIYWNLLESTWNLMTPYWRKLIPFFADFFWTFFQYMPCYWSFLHIYYSTKFPVKVRPFEVKWGQILMLFLGAKTGISPMQFFMRNRLVVF